SRKQTDGIFCFPRDPLSQSAGRPADDAVAEAWRRHVPCVLVGACAHSAKLHAVVPDYVDAGYRVTEHLHLSGCTSFAILHAPSGGRKPHLVLSGCQPAAARFGRPLSTFALDMPEGNLPAMLLDNLRPAAKNARPAPRLPMGLACVGTIA